MNESDVNKLAAAPAAADIPVVSFGRALAVAREARGLSVGDIAARLRLQPRQIRAIEAEDMSALPHGPFVRGFVRNYAREVGIDAGPLLDALQTRLQPTAPFADAPGGRGGPGPVQLAQREQVSQLTVIGGAIAALLLFAIAGWLAMRPAPSAVVAPKAAAPTAAAAAPSAPATAPLEPVAAPVPPTNAASESAAPAAATDALHLRFREPAWVEIIQGDGKVLMSQTNEAGSQRTVAGVPPYTLVIGNATAVELEFRGKPVDLSLSRSRENVARLRLE